MRYLFLNRTLLYCKKILRLITFISTIFIFSTISYTSLAQTSSGKNNNSNIIKDIIIEGSQRIEPLTILYQIELEVGEKYSNKSANRSIKKLFSTGLFSDVSMDMVNGILTITVLETPIINNVSFEGNSLLTDASMAKEVSISSRQPLNRSKISKSLKRLLDIYQAGGYFNASIKPQIIRLSQNRVNLIFNINEGVKGIIRSIRFIGNTNFYDYTLRDILQSREGRWYVFNNKKTYDPNRIKFDESLLKKFYLEKGFLNFRLLDTIVELHPNQEDFLLTFVIEEGQRYNLRSVTVNSILPGLDTTILQNFADDRFSKGNLYSVEDANEFLNEIRIMAESQGYYPIIVTPETTTDVDKAEVDLLFDISLGQRLYVETINILGNSRTHDSVIRRSLLFVEGELFKPESIRESHTVLTALDYFKKINIVPRAGSRHDKVIVDITVEEKSTGSIKFSGGYDTSYGIQGGISFAETNLSGKGYIVDASILIAQKVQNYSLSFTDPYFLGKNLALGGDLFSLISLSTSSRFNSKYQGARIHIGYPLGRYFRQTFRIEASYKNVRNYGKLPTPYLNSSLGEFALYGVGHLIKFSNVNNIRHSHSGFTAKFDTSVFALSKKVNYYKTFLDTNIFIPVTTNTTLLIKNRVSYILSLKKNRSINITDRFFSGEDSLPRGFEVSGIGPRSTISNISLGGNFSWVSTVELEFPIGFPKDLDVFGIGFFDAATILLNDEKEISGHPINKTKSIRTAAGLGIRWYSPFAPLTLTYTWPITKAKHDITQSFGFSFRLSY